MRLSKEAEKEMIEFSRSEDFRSDIESLRSTWKIHFVHNGTVDVDGYIEFVTQFNEFINHRPKLFKPMIDRDMRL
jgi:hypothetical protein